MLSHRLVGTLAVSVVAFSANMAAALPAAAGGVGDLLSPAFGVSCFNLGNDARADGSASHTSGLVAGVPLTSALNQCGGADLQPSGGLLSVVRRLDVEDLTRYQLLKVAETNTGLASTANITVSEQD